MNQIGPKGAMFPATALAGAVILIGAALKSGADANHVAPASAAAQLPHGIALDYQDNTEQPIAFAHRPGELVGGRSGAAFAVDSLLTTDANGKLIAASAGNYVWAIAREAATAADQLVCVEVVAPGTKA
jgi:hypothetical protein